MSSINFAQTLETELFAQTQQTVHKSREERSKSAFTEENIVTVRQLILQDLLVTYRQLEALQGISGTTIKNSCVSSLV